jgi:NodT family efflux transporter outer membrane factor (OMF) lipoprotein
MRDPLPPRARAARLLMASSLAASALAGCASFDGIFSTAKVADPAPLGLHNPSKPELASTEASRAWWTLLGDAQLSALIDQALAQNPGLRAAQARLGRLQAMRDAAAASEAPRVNGGLDVMRQRYSANGLFPPPIAGATVDSATLQLSAGWEFDFFGKNRAALDAALGQERANEADTLAARNVLAASVARTYLNLVRLQAQLQLAQRTLALREQTHALVQDRVKAGLDTQLELQQSESALPDARLQIEQLQEQVQLGLNALASLTAQPVSALKLQIPSLNSLTLPATVRSLPLALLGQRADIAAARWRIEASVKDVDAAKAQFYPNVNLVAFAGLSSLGLDRLFKEGSDQWGVGPAISLPLFDGGRLRANLRGKVADQEAAVESYNAQVLEAVHEVSDRIASAQAITRQQQELGAALASAETALAIALQRYEAGLGNYLSVLSAESPVISLRRQQADLRARALDTQVQLLQALGTKPAQNS